MASHVKVPAANKCRVLSIVPLSILREGQISSRNTEAVFSQSAPWSRPHYYASLKGHWKTRLWRPDAKEVAMLTLGISEYRSLLWVG